MNSLSGKFTVRKRIQFVSPLKHYKIIIIEDINRPSILRMEGVSVYSYKDDFHGTNLIFYICVMHPFLLLYQKYNETDITRT